MVGYLCRNQTLVTTVVAFLSFCFLFVSVVTNHWLYTSEKRPDVNGTTLLFHIYSGLWKKCVQDARYSFSNCSYISYFTHVEKDGISSTESILLSLRRAVAFPLMGLVLQLIAQTACFLSLCSLRRQTLTISSGVLFVAGGLLTLVGIIIYIGAVTEEAGNKVRSSSDDPKFRYRYGPSLLLAIGSFVGSQLTGVMSVHVFISRREEDYAKTRQLAAIIETDGTTTTKTTPTPSTGSPPKRPGAPPPRGPHPPDVDQWRGCYYYSPSRSDTFCSHATASKEELSSYSLLSNRDLATASKPVESDCADPRQGGAAGGWTTASVPPPPPLPPQREQPVLFREWSEGSTATRTDLSRQWSERSVDARSSCLSREWSRCSTDELHSSCRRITPV